MQQKVKFFKWFFSNVSIRIKIENEIYCYINGFLKWNISKKTRKEGNPVKLERTRTI